MLRSYRYSSKGIIFCSLLLAVAIGLRAQGQTIWGDVLLAASIVGLLAVAFEGVRSRNREADNGRL